MIFKNLGKGLKDKETQFKSLKFGKDRPGGGSSNQPYITTTIPTGDPSPKSNGDFILRGGTKSLKRMADDSSRLLKMFFDTKSPAGANFILKQNLLSRIAVKTETSGEFLSSPSLSSLNEGLYLPSSTILSALSSPLGIHLNKQGINFSKKTDTNNPLNSKLGLPTYLSIIEQIKNIENNRLSKLLKLVTTTPKENIIREYPGGPGSNLGVGKTQIKRYTNTYNAYDSLSAENKPNFIKPEIIGNLEKNGKIDFKDSNYIDYTNNLELAKEKFPYKPSYYKDITKTRENIINFTIPEGKKGYKDQINSKSSYYSSSFEDYNDFVKFRIGIVDNDKPENKFYLHFRAFINDFNDSYKSDWENFQYSGRGESFHRYKSFDRDISLSWTIAALSREEIYPMYEKLNFLASSLAPHYGTNGYMKGNISTLTLGGYLYEQPGIIKSISFSPPKEASWDINIEGGKKELPMIIEVTNFTFTPIHEFTPERKTNFWDDKRFISLKNKEESRYDKKKPINLSSTGIKGLIYIPDLEN